jgi:hypothetical protein
MNRGDALIVTLVLLFVFSLMMVPFLDTLGREIGYGPGRVNREEAFQIAEAGISYYQWHLAHYPTDYKDGTTTPGPYVHTFTDADTGQAIGQFTLTITPPPVGSTIVTITAAGKTFASPNTVRTITARYGIPSLAQYSFLSNDIVWIGANESVSGKMQSNNGIRFDGGANAPIMSAKATYTCSSNQGSPCPHTENGVWGSASSSVKSFWQFPVPVVDFSALTSNLASLKAQAQASGMYLSPSSANGYSLVFNAAGTVSVYKVTSLTANPSGTDVYGNAENQNTDYKNRTLLYTKPIPANGIIYIEDTTWVEGVVKGRVMVASAILPYNPSTAPNIYIPNNIVYAAKDGTNVLGLLAQNSIVPTYHAPNVLEIDGALIAQNGSAEFYYYQNNIKTSITIFGSIMSYGQWTWTWVGGGSTTSGYTTTNDTYDSNLLYGPPPGFPLSTAGYQQMSWTSN